MTSHSLSEIGQMMRDHCDKSPFRIQLFYLNIEELQHGRRKLTSKKPNDTQRILERKNDKYDENKKNIANK